jgi:hypothetical protein
LDFTGVVSCAIAESETTADAAKMSFAKLFIFFLLVGDIRRLTAQLTNK